MNDHRKTNKMTNMRMTNMRMKNSLSVKLIRTFKFLSLHFLIPAYRQAGVILVIRN